MSIEEIENTLTSWKNSLPKKQKRYIHFKSLANFVFHFNNLPNEKIKEKVLIQLNEYVGEIEERSFVFTGKESYELATTHLNQLSDIYSSYLNFKSIMELRFIVLFSILGDGILYLILKNKLSFYFPIVSVSLLTYHFSRKLTLEKKRKLFGLFY